MVRWLLRNLRDVTGRVVGLELSYGEGMVISWSRLRGEEKGGSGLELLWSIILIAIVLPSNDIGITYFPSIVKTKNYRIVGCSLLTLCSLHHFSCLLFLYVYNKKIVKHKTCIKIILVLYQSFVKEFYSKSATQHTNHVFC